MTVLEIQGKDVEVDDKFLKLSPKEKNEFVAQIASSLGLKPEAAGAGMLDKAAGVAKQSATGLRKGVADLAGLPGDAAGILGQGADWLADKAGLPPVAEKAGKVLPSILANALPAPARAAVEAYRSSGDAIPEKAREIINPLRGSEVANRVMQDVTGPYRKPENVPEEYGDTVGRFVGNSVAGGASTARNALLGFLKTAGLYGVVPGVASETAGQAFKDGPAEPYARAGAGLVAGGGAALTQRVGSAERLVANATRGVTPQQIDQMEALFNQAQQAGTPISRAEALQHVTRGGTGMGELQHTVEGMGGMKPFYAERPAQNQAAMNRTADSIAPPAVEPSQIGPAAGAAGENIVTRIRSAINDYTRPMYDAGGQHQIPQQVHQAMMADPLFSQTATRIRNTPELNAVVQNAPDRSVRFYDAVAKEMEQGSRNAAQPLNPQASQTVASVLGTAGRDTKDIAIASERAATGGPSSYEAALATQARLRREYLEPVLNGPIGKIAGQDTTTKSAVEALFPANPLPNSQAEIGQTMRALSRQRPGVANDLVRAHAEMTFNEAAQRMASGGANQSGGAKFAAVLRGNEQQAANLEAAVTALPNGDAIWGGFNRMLDVFEAQQMRQATGSRTAFKIPGVDDLKAGGIVNNAAQVIGGAGIPLSKKVTNAIQSWNIGRNVDELAELLTSPEAAESFRRLATLPSGSAQSVAVINRLGNIALVGKRAGNRAAGE